MQVKIPEDLATLVGERKMLDFGVSGTSFTWQKFATVDLGGLSPEKTGELRALVLPHADKVRGGGVLLRDIDTWTAALSGGKAARTRSVKQFEPLLTETLYRVPGHRIYKRSEASGEAWLCFYASHIDHHEEYKDNGYTTPEHVTLRLIWESFGGKKKLEEVFYEDDCRGITVTEALSRKGYYVETSELRATYKTEVARFASLARQVGLQCLAGGIGTDNLDGNNKKNGGWWSSRINQVVLMREGQKSRVVVDVYNEEDKKDRESTVSPDLWFWPNEARRKKNATEQVVPKKKAAAEDTRKDLPEEDVEEPTVIEIPVHPFVACFDLRRHLRLRVHVSDLTPYMYDITLRERLVLPEDVKGLIEILLAGKGTHRDIVDGKGGGAVVLCGGPAGTGKTLTAEVYAESTGRPLYSVQASQLGTDPEELEDELLKVFARAARWNAILLIDEADVYVMERGNDLAQNAIVGVLLRVLEYYSGILFLTTNRTSVVDDAITSRCVARILYELPTEDEQLLIWRILADTAGIKISNAEIATIVKAIGKKKRVSGRDIKSLLKLASMVSKARGVPVTAAIVEHVSRFTPTGQPQ